MQKGLPEEYIYWKNTEETKGVTSKRKSIRKD
jgi:hypothetical protein